MRWKVTLQVEADSVDDAAAEVAAILSRAEADPAVVTSVVTHGGPDPILHFASAR